LDTTELEPRVVNQLENEAAWIFAKAGVKLTFVHQSPSADLMADAQSAPYVVILPQIPTGVVSELHRIGGHKRPVMACLLPPNRYTSKSTIYLSRASVEATIHVGWTIRLPSNLLARALGRVLAHELAHLVLGPKHSDYGILKDNLTRKDLMDFDSRPLRFDRNQLRALRSACLSGRLHKSAAVPSHGK
jgi:hypothetical protein